MGNVHLRGKTHSSASSDEKLNDLPSLTMSRKLNPESKVVRVSEQTVEHEKKEGKSVKPRRIYILAIYVEGGRPRGNVRKGATRHALVNIAQEKCVCLPVTAGKGICKVNELESYRN